MRIHDHHRAGAALAILLAGSVLAACDRTPSQEEIRDTVSEQVESARTEVGGTVEAAVEDRVEAVQTAGLATTAAGAVIVAGEAIDVAKEAASWVVKAGSAVTGITAAQEALADDPSLLTQDSWLTPTTNAVADLRSSGEDAAALADIIAAKGTLAVAQEPFAAIGTELMQTADRLDEALATGDAAAVAAATPNLSAVLGKIDEIRELISSP
jgi:hypothetical protein